MHPSALATGQIFFETYTNHLNEALVIDLGAQNINGSLRSVCPERFKYIGVDFVEGRGIDVVLEDPYQLPFDPDSIDIVVCSSVFEHAEFFWLLFLEIMRVLKPTGLLYLNVPSNGDFHRYPVDCWRFYPDAGSALVRWARRNHIPATLLESFTSVQDRDQWNDFVTVVLKNGLHSGNYPTRIIQGRENFTNGITDQDLDAIIRHRAEPEDRKRLIETRRSLDKDGTKLFNDDQ